MSKRDYKIYDYNYNYQESLNSQIKVNKRSDIANPSSKYNNYHKMSNNSNNKDSLYYNIDKKTKIQKNKIPLSLNKKSIKKVPEDNIKNSLKYNNHDTFKKTINTYSNENRVKEGNIIEDLQNNKYLRPMLCATNINNKLIKCQIESPIKNIFTLTLKNYNIGLPFELYKSPQKNNIDISDSGKISANREDIYQSKKYERNTDGLVKMQKKKCFFSEERKEKDNVKKDNKNEIYNYYKKANDVNSLNNNILRSKNNNINKYNKYSERNNISKIKSKNNSKDNKLLQIYKIKLIEEFIIVLNKFIYKHLNKNRNFFLKNLMKFKNKSESKNKIYFKKKNNAHIKKQLTNNGKLNKPTHNTEKEKMKNKATTDTSTNFNLNNQSFSNEKKSSSKSNNFISNLFITNNKLSNNQSSSLLFTHKKHKNYSQSPEETFIPKSQIKTKTIIYKKHNSGPPNRSLEEQGRDKFVYKKKNLNNENIYINRINNIDINNFYSNNNINNKYNNYITHNKKGKIIDIDINLGKPIQVINDHGPIDDLFFENNEPFLFKLNTISSKFSNKNKKKKKAKSGSKNKIKPPLRLKRFAEEDNEKEVINNCYIDNYKPHYINKKDNDNDNIAMDIKLKNKLKEFNKNNVNEDSSDLINEYIIESDKLHIRNNCIYYDDSKFKNNKNFKNLKKEKNISLMYINHKIKIYLNKNRKRNVNKLYINCTKFFINALSRIIKNNIFILIFKLK